MNFPKLTLLKGFSDTGAALKIAMRIGRNMAGQEEEPNEEFDKIIRSRKRFQNRIKNNQDKRALVLCIQSELPDVMPPAIEGVKQLDLDVLDFLDILNVRSLPVEDQRYFVNKWSEQSNFIEFVEWISGLVNSDVVSIGRTLQSFQVKKVLQDFATVAPAFQLAFERMSQLYRDD